MQKLGSEASVKQERVNVVQSARDNKTIKEASVSENSATESDKADSESLTGRPSSFHDHKK